VLLVQNEAGLANGLMMAADTHIDKMFAPGVSLVRRTVKLNFAGIGVSLLDASLSEVLYFSASGIRYACLCARTCAYVRVYDVGECWCSLEFPRNALASIIENTFYRVCLSHATAHACAPGHVHAHTQRTRKCRAQYLPCMYLHTHTHTHTYIYT
jgi:hypothetical protein